MVLCDEGQDSFFCFVSLGEDLCPLLKFHFWECVVDKILWVASLHKVFSSNVLIEEFVLLSVRASPFIKPFFAPDG